MTSIEQQRAAHDRRSRAWVFLVFGVLVVWLVGLTGLGADQTVWNVVGYAGILGGAALIVAALVLFQKPRP